MDGLKPWWGGGLLLSWEWFFKNFLSKLNIFQSFEHVEKSSNAHVHLIRNRKCHSVVLYIFNDLNPLNKNFIQTHVPENVSICSNTVSSSPYDEEQQKGPLLPNIHLMPLVFDVLSLVPRSQQAEMLFSSFTLGKRMNLTDVCQW